MLHDFQFHQNLIAKCEQSGGEEYKCVCGETKLENQTSAMEHSVEFWDFENETRKAGTECTFVQTYKDSGESISYQRCTMCGIIVRDEYASRPLEVTCSNESGDTMTVNYRNPKGSTATGIDATASFVAYAVAVGESMKEFCKAFLS